MLRLHKSSRCTALAAGSAMQIRLSLRGAVDKGADLWTWDAFSEVPEGMGNV